MVVADTKKVLSVAVDGSMALSHIDGTECSTSVLYRSKGSTAFTAVSWATSHACYTGSLQGTYARVFLSSFNTHSLSDTTSIKHL